MLSTVLGLELSLKELECIIIIVIIVIIILLLMRTSPGKERAEHQELLTSGPQMRG